MAIRKDWIIESSVGCVQTVWQPHPGAIASQEAGMESVGKDILYALRVLRRHPGFTAAIVLSLGLGIGANTAIFTLLDSVLWRMLPVSDPEHLLVVGQQQGANVRTGFNYSAYRLLHENNGLADVAGYTTAPINVSVDGPPEPSIQGQLVSGGYFSLLGVSPAIGRALGPDDDRVPNGHPVAMLSRGYWERRFGSDPSVVGRTIRLSDMPFTIVGVTPAEFFGVEIGTAPDVFLPLMMQPTVMPSFENLLDQPIVNRSWVQAIARARPGVTPEQAAAAMNAAQQGQQDLQGRAPQAPPATLVLTPTAAVSSLRQQFRGPSSSSWRWSASCC